MLKYLFISTLLYDDLIKYEVLKHRQCGIMILGSAQETCLL